MTTEIVNGTNESDWLSWVLLGAFILSWGVGFLVSLVRKQPRHKYARRDEL